MKNLVALGLTGILLVNCGKTSHSKQELPQQPVPTEETGKPETKDPAPEKQADDKTKTTQDDTKTQVPATPATPVETLKPGSDEPTDTSKPAKPIEESKPVETTVPTPTPVETTVPTPTPVETTVPTPTPVETTVPTPTPEPPPTSNIRIIIGQLQELPVDVDPVCDADHVGSLTLSITNYSSYAPMIRLCVQKDSWGELKFENESIWMDKVFIGEKITAQSVASAVVWNTNTKKVEGYVLASKIWTDKYGTNCSFRSNITSGGGTCGIKWDDRTSRKVFLTFGSDSVVFTLNEQSMEAPLQPLRPRSELPAQSLESLLTLLQSQTNESKQWGLLNAISSIIKGNSLDQQKLVIDQIHEMADSGKLSRSAFSSFVGNSGSLYALDWARPLVESSKVDDLREGLSMLRLVNVPEVMDIHLKAFDKYYARSVDTDTSWSDFNSAQVVRSVIDYLKAFGGVKEKEHVRAVHDANPGRQREVENYLKP